MSGVYQLVLMSDTLSGMGLLYKSEKRAIFKAAVFTIVALAILGASIRYWYVAVPVIAVIAGLLVLARQARRAANTRARESMIHEPDDSDKRS